MKSTGIVRKIDELGRIVLPIEMRRTLDIAERDPLEIYVEGSKIILKKYIVEEASPESAPKYICSICSRELEGEDAEHAVHVKNGSNLKIKAHVKRGKK